MSRAMTFKGGIHVPDNKHFTRESPVETLPPPDKVFLPLLQHIGAPAKLLVKKGDIVKTGQKIAEASGFISAPVHSSVSGEVLEIKKLPHPVFGVSEAVVIQRRGEEWTGLNKTLSYESFSGPRLTAMIREAGVVGMGGACFPTSVKLSVPEHAKIDTLIINGAECEPYLSSDYRIMLENAGEIITGTKILAYILKPERCIIALEDNKPLAAEKLIEASQSGIEVMTLPTKYPQGGEKQLIKAILGREVPSGGLPLDVGAVVDNAGTALAVKEAVIDGKPLIERVVTVTGENIKTPKNLRVRLGTPFSTLIEYCGGFKQPPGKLIAGGPMMGIAQYSPDAPVLKGTSGLLSFYKDGIRKAALRACIRCGKCVEACPAGLIPSDLARFAEKGAWNTIEGRGLMDCFECGCCSYVCPSAIPIVHYIKYAKAKKLRGK